MPKTFIVLPYLQDQNEPSLPVRKLITAENDQELLEKAKQVFKETCSLEDDCVITTTTDTEYGDYCLSVGDVMIFLTEVA